MIVRRLIVLVCTVATAAVFFALGTFYSRRVDAAVNASYDARLDALREELQRALARSEDAEGATVGTSGTAMPGEVNAPTS